jgi:hypothetical protein
MAEKQSGRHPVNVGHLVMGIAFLGLVGVWALVQGDVVGGGDVRWLLPVPWVLAGLSGLLAIGVSGSRRWSTRQTGWVGAPAASADRSRRDTPTDTPSDTPSDTEASTEASTEPPTDPHPTEETS